MSTAAPTDVLAALRWRYATKKFDATRKIAPAVWALLEEALRLSPSTFGVQPWKFFVVADPAVREKLRAAAWNQSQVVDASHLVVFAVKKGVGPADAEKLIAHTADTRGTPPGALDQYKAMIVGALSGRPAEEVDHWMTRQVYVALGVFLVTAAALGVDACPMEGFQPALVDETLGLPKKGYGAVVLATAGYRAADDAYAGLAKVRYAPADVVERV